MKDDIKMMNAPKGRTLMPGTIRNPDGPGGVNVLPPGTKLNEFEIISLIGEGGFGIVYLAYDHSLKRHVALKEYMPSGLASRTKTLCVTAKSNQHANNFAAGLRSFVNEARLLAQFDSPFLVKVYRFWEANGTAYMVMPYYEGVTLKQASKEGRIVPTEEWIKSIFARLLDAVEMMHQVRCFHRDIAPDNILMLKDGSPLLLDFGAARQVIGNLTQCLTVIVKPGFAPIEQYADIPGLKQGAWTDVYALAAVVYYLISGKLPPAVARIVSDEMVPAREAGKGRYSASFLAGLDKALTVRPENRIQSIPELRKALGIPSSSKGAAPPPPQPAKPEIESTARMTAPLPPAGRSAPRVPVNHTTLLNEDAFPKSLIIGERRDFGSERKAGRLPALALSFLLSLGVAGGAAWTYLHYTHMKPAKLATIAAVREKPAPSRPAAAISIAAPDRADATRSPAPPVTPATPAPPAPSAPSARPASPPALPPAPAPSAPVHVARPVTPPAAETAVAPAVPRVEQKAAEPDRARGDAAAEAARSAVLPGPAPDPAVTSGASGGSEVHSMDYPKGRYAEVMGSRPEARQPKVAPAKPAPVPRDAAQDKSARLASATPAPALPSSAGDRTPAGSHSVAMPQPPSLESEPAKKPSAADAPLALAPKSAAPDTARDNGHAPEVRDKPAAGARPTEPAAAPAKPQPRDAAPRAEPDKPGDAGKKTIRFADQTMTGDFTVDPATGIVSGKGRIVWTNGNQFEGTLVRGVKEGKGRFLWANGQLYSGDWSKDSPNGKGLLVFANGNRYEGEVKDGVPHGQGTTKFKGGDVYSGTWVNGKSHGHGRYTWANGSYFEGEFKDGKRTENGKTVFADRGESVAADSSK